MKKIGIICLFLLLALAILGTTYGQWSQSLSVATSSLNTAPAPVVAAPTIAVAGTSATLSSNLTSLGTATNVTGSFQISTDGVTWQDVGGTTPMGSAGAFSTSSTLTSSQTYECRAEAQGLFTAYSGVSTFTMTAGLQITTSSLPDGQSGVSYSQPIVYIGGTAPFNFSISSGNLPGGFILSNATISGTTTNSGTYSFVIEVSDHAGNVAYSNTLSITINGGGLDHITVTPSNPSVAEGISMAFTANGYNSNGSLIPGLVYTWSIASGQSDAGSVNSSGVFTAGTIPGTYTGAITATASGKTGTASVTVAATGGPYHYAVTDITSPQVAGVPFTLTIQAKDAFNNNVTSTNDTLLNVTFSKADTGATPTSSPISNGTATISMTLKTAWPSQAITVTGATSLLTSTSNYFDVNPGPLQSIIITPSYPSVAKGHTIAFIAQGQDQYYNHVSATYTWTIVSGQGAAGSINSAGLFTAGTAAGTYNNAIQVTANSIIATTSVTVTNPAVTGISPSNGLLGGGTSVTITGTDLSGATAVKFGNNSATITNNTTTQIIATSPAGSSTGTVHITVTTAGGTSATSPADQFTYTTLSNISKIFTNNNGIGDGKWSTAGNWSPNGAPSTSDNVEIQAVCIIDTTATCADMTIDSGITLSENTNVAVNIAGSLSNNGTYTASSGTHTFSGATKTIGGTSAITIPSVAITGTITNNGTLTVTAGLSGTGTLTNGATGTLNIGGTSGITTLTATAVGNTVNYTGVAQTVKATTYVNLGLSGTGAKTTTGITVNGNFTVGGDNTVTVSAAPTYGTAATLQYSKTAPFTTGFEWPATFNGTGGVIIGGIGTITTNTAKTLGTNVPLTINAGATLATGATNTWTLTVGGTTSVSGTLTLANTGAKTFTGAVTINSGATLTESVAAALSFGSDVTINGTLTENGAAVVGIAGNLTNNGTYNASTGTHTFSGAAKTIGGTISIPNVAITGTITNSGTLTITTALTGVGTLTNGDGTTGTLNIGGTSTITTLIATASGNTVNYTGTGAQTVKATTYVNLGISGGSGNIKTLGGNITASGILTIATSTSLSFGTGSARTLTLSGTGTNTLANSGTINMSGGNLAHLLQIAASSIASFGTLTNGTGNTVAYNASGPQTVNAVTYYNLTLSGSGAKTLDSAMTMIGGSLTLSGTVSTTTVVGLAITGNLSVGDSTTFTADAFALTVTGTSTIGAGTSGNLTISSATGAKLFTGLVKINAGGTWTNTSANSPVEFRGGINNSGTFNAGNGIYTFDTNAQALTGTFIIPSVTVTTITLTNNGTLTVGTALEGTGGLTQAANAALNIGGTSGITTLTATNTGNTVNYTGAGQKIHSNNYYHLTLSGSGTDVLQTLTTTISGTLTLSGTVFTTTVVGLTITGNLAIGDGTTFTAAGFALTVTGTTTVGAGTSGNLTISSANGAKLFTGLVTISANGTWANTSANSPITFRGGITNNGTFNAGTGAQTFSTNAQALTGTFTIPNVTVTGVTLTNNNTLTVATLLTVTSPGILLNNGTITAITALSGTGGLTQGPTSLLNIGGTSGITTLTATAAGNTVNYTGTSQTIKVVAYSNLTLSGGAETFGAITTIGGNLTLNGTATATTGAALTIGGNLSIATGTTLATGATSTWTLGVTGTTSVSGTLTLANTGIKNFTGDATVNSGGALIETAAATLSFGSNVAINGTFTEFGATTISIDGTLSGTGGLTQTASSTLNLGGASTITTLTATANGNTVNYTGATQTINATTYYNLTLSGNGAMSLATGISVTGKMTLTSPAIANIATGAGINVRSLFLGGVNQAVGTWGYSGQLNNNTSYFANTTGFITVAAVSPITSTDTGGTWALTGTWIGGVAPNGNDDVVIATTTGNSVILGATVTQYGTLTINNGATLTMSTFLLTLNGDLNNSGTVNGTTGGVTIAGTATQSIGSFTTTGTVSMTKTAGGTATFTGNVSGAALTINGTGGTLNLGTGTHTFTGIVTLTAGTLNGGSSILNENATSTTAWNGTGTVFNAGTGTVNFGGAAQTISATATTFNNLTLSGSGAKTFTNANTINGILSMAGTATVTYTTTQSMGASSTIQYNKPALFTTGAEWPATFSGTGGIIIVGAGVITMNGVKVLNVGVPLTINSGATLATGNYALSIGGNWSNSGTFTVGTATVTLNGTSTQTISGSTPTTFYGLTVNNSNGITLGSNITVTSALTLTNGILTTGSNTVIAYSGTTNATVTRTSGYVYGNLKKYVATGGSTITFEVGTATANDYTPAKIVFTSVTAAGTLTVTSTSGEEPHYSNWPISSTAYVNVYWTLTNSTIAGGTYTVDLTWLNSDLIGGATASSLFGAQYISSWSSKLTPSVRNTNDTTLNGSGSGFTTNSGFGDFVLGN